MSNVMDRETKTIIGLILFALVLSTGLGYYFGSITTPQQSQVTTSTTTSTSSITPSPYVLTLVITTANTFNSSVGQQPAYYVLGPNGLQSSANITLPANRMIEVVIMNYDEGNATPISPQYYNVMGTVNGTMSVISNNVINSSEGPSGIVITGTQTVSSLPAALISHTFTVPGLNLNIPVAAETTVIAYFMSGAAGNYAWFCTTPCGSGQDGLAGAMSTPGWMSGSIAVA
jgi:heme/copper-type cytochrome/quinol oxidase subunit 2